MYVCMFVCMYVCMYVCIYIYNDNDTHTHTHCCLACPVKQLDRLTLLSGSLVFRTENFREKFWPFSP